MTQTNDKQTKDERWQKIDAAIDESIEPSPDSAHALADELRLHPTLVARRLQKRFVWRNGRWVWKGKGEHE